MAKYSDIKGFTVQTLSTDTVASQFAGGSWASGGSLPGGRNSAMGFGTQTAALVGGGYNGTNYVNTTFEYDGSSWTAGGDLTASAGQARAGHGILTAGGAVAGYKTSGNAVINNYETYDGSSFTEQADLNTARQTLSASGSTTAALGVGGTNSTGPGSTQSGLTNVESYNGSSWSETTEINTGRKQGTSFSGGPAPTMILVGGASGSTLYANTETYNGSAWTEITDINTARSTLGGAGQAQTDGLVFGGSVPANTAVTEQWNGTTWTELADLSTARSNVVGSGTGAASALGTGGYSTDYVSASEEFTAPAVFNQITEGQLFFNSTTNTFKETILDVPGGTWASNTAAPTASTERWGAGTSNSNALIGAPPGAAMEWNGSSWTDGGTVNNNNQGRGGTGGISAALIWGGSPTPANATTEEYNGTAWTEKNDLNTGGSTQPTGPTGTYTDLISAGRGPGFAGVSESWNGTSWTETADLSTARRSLGSSGASSTDCAVFGGTTPPNNNVANTEQWNGSAWTETADLNTARGAGMGFGVSSQTLAYVAGTSYPSLPPYNTKTEAFNGSTWTEVNDLPNGRYHNKGGGSAASALTAGGYLASPAGGQTTENLVWEANLANKTITAS